MTKSLQTKPRKRKAAPHKRRAKPGTSRTEAARRRNRFIEVYLVNGGNAKQAAITVGYSAHTAEQLGSRLLRDVKVSGALAEATEKAAKAAGLNVDKTLREVARLAYADPRKLYRNGRMVSVERLDDETAAAIASVEVDGKNRKVRFWSKPQALDQAMKYHGLYERDNTQRGDAAIRALMEAVGQNAAKFDVKP